MGVKYKHQEVIDIPKMVEECSENWFNQTLTKIKDSVTRIDIIDGEYHWHKHDDEFLFMLSGKLYIDLENRTIELNPHQGATISKGVMQRTRGRKRPSC